MRLEVKALHEEKRSYNITQRYAAFSKGSLVGTRNLFNCMGIVIYNRVGECGVVAHVEAQNVGYAGAVDSALETMMHTLNTSGGDVGSVAVVLLGNAAGHDAEFCEQVEASLYKHAGARFRLNKFDILDLRNSQARGKIGAAKTELGGLIGGFVLDPARETLWVDSFSHVLDVDAKPGDVKQFPIQ